MRKRNVRQWPLQHCNVIAKKNSKPWWLPQNDSTVPSGLITKVSQDTSAGQQQLDAPLSKPKWKYKFILAPENLYTPFYTYYTTQLVHQTPCTSLLLLLLKGWMFWYCREDWACLTKKTLHDEFLGEASHYKIRTQRRRVGVTNLRNRVYKSRNLRCENLHVFTNHLWGFCPKNSQCGFYRGYFCGKTCPTSCPTCIQNAFLKMIGFFLGTWPRFHLQVFNVWFKHVKLKNKKSMEMRWEGRVKGVLWRVPFDWDVVEEIHGSI